MLSCWVIWKPSGMLLRISKLNKWLAVKLTNAVGSMWTAYIFSILALIGLPSALKQGTLAIVQWIAQTFLQLVLLSVIMVGQKVQAEANEKLVVDTHTIVKELLKDVHAELKLIKKNDQTLAKMLVDLETKFFE